MEARVLAVQDLDFEEAAIFHEEMGYSVNDYLRVVRDPSNRLLDFNGNPVWEVASDDLAVSTDAEGYGLDKDGVRVSTPEGYLLQDGRLRVPVYKSPPLQVVQVLHFLWMRRNDPEHASMEAARKAKPIDMVGEADPTPGGTTA